MPLSLSVAQAETDEEKQKADRQRQRQEQKRLSDEEEAAAARANYKPPSTNRRYRGADLMIPPSDRKGHSSAAQVNVPPWLMQEAQAIFESGKFPFRGIGDIGRLGWYMAVEYLRKAEAVKPNWWAQMELMNAIVKEDMARSELDQMFDGAAARVRELEEEGDEKAKRELVAQLKKSIEDHAKGVWRKRFENRFKKEFGKM